jgi:hypothetical protein
VISKEDFEKLGAVLMPKIQAAASDGSLVDAPFYWDIARSWKHLGDPAAAKEWLGKGIEANGRFTAKVVKGMVAQSSSGDGIRYTYRKHPDEDLYDVDVVYENAKRQLNDTKGLTDDEQALLKALVAGIDGVRAGKSPDRFEDDDDE